MTKLTIVGPGDGEPASGIIIPAGHLFIGISYVPPSQLELTAKTQRIKDNLAAGFRELLEIHEHAEWRADPKYRGWDDYCRQELEISGNMGYKKAAAGKVNQALLTAGLKPVKERVARVVSDLPTETAVAVVTKAIEIEATKPRVGRDALYHKRGKVTARTMEQARAEVVPASPHPVDVELVAPLPPKRKRYEPQPIESQIIPYDIRRDTGETGIVLRFEVDGKKLYCHLRQCEWQRFFPDPF